MMMRSVTYSFLKSSPSRTMHLLPLLTRMSLDHARRAPNSQPQMCGTFSQKGRTRQGAAFAREFFLFIFLPYFHILLNFSVEYSSSTSTGVLRVHLERVHKNDYLESCKEHGWRVKQNGQEVYEAQQFTMDRFKTALLNWIV